MPVWLSSSLRLIVVLPLVALCLLWSGCGDPDVSIIDTSLNGDTQNGRGPFGITTVVDGAEIVDSATLFFRADRGEWSSAKMREAAPGRFTGQIDPLAVSETPWPLGTLVEYYVEVQPRQGSEVRDPPRSPMAFSFTIGSQSDLLRLTDITPRAGPAAGGTTVFLTGEGFRPGSEVRLGAARATDVEVVSPGFIRAKTPPGDPGVVDVTVTDGLGHFRTLEDAFTYLAPPEITRVEPDHGPTRGGTSVAVIGQHFQPESTVRFGDLDVATVAYVSPFELRVITPPGEAGAVDVTVSNPDGQSGTLAGAFTYQPPPSVSEVEPSIGSSSGGTVIRIRGADLQEGARVAFDGVEIPCVWLDEATIRCTTPPHDEGFVDVTIINPDGESVTLEDGFEYLAPPEIFAVIPGEGLMTGGETVQVEGRGFFPGATVTFGGVEAMCDFISRERMSCVTPRAEVEGFVDVGVVNPDGQSDLANDAFLYLFPPPEILDIRPPQVSDLGGEQLVLTVDWLREGALVSFDQGVCDVQAIVLDEDSFQGQIFCETPAHPEGFSDVTVTNPDGQSGTREDGVYFLGPPRLIRVEPPQGFTEGGDEVTLVGENLSEGMVATFDGLVVTVVSVTPDGTRAVVITAPHDRGVVDVSVTNPDGRSDTLVAGFEYIWRPPFIDQLEPDRGATWGGGSVAIIGDFFRPGARVRVGGVELAPGDYVFIDSTRIEITSMPPGLGEVIVEVINPDDQVSNPAIYTYEPIQLTPDGGLSAGFTNVTATGFDFVNGITVTIGGQPAQGIIVDGENSMRFITPPGALGDQNVVVTLPDGRSETIVGGFTFRRFVEQSSSGLLNSPNCQTVDTEDLDGDGDEDVIVGNGDFESTGGTNETNTIQFNNGAASFGSDATLSPPGRTLNQTFDDINNDGDLDLFVINLGGASQLYLNNGSGGMSVVTTNRLPSDVTEFYDAKFVDVNNDGSPDLFSIMHVESPEALWLNDGGGFFIESSGDLPFDGATQEHDHDIAVGDINGDGWIDALVGVDNINGFIGRNLLFINTGGGIFDLDESQPFTTNLDRSDVLDVELIDIDNDGDLDALIGDNLLVDFQALGGRNGLYMFINDGNGGFTLDTSRVPQDLTVDVFNIVPADVDNDGDLDIVLSTASDTTDPAANFITKHPNQLLVNDGSGVLHDASVSWSSTAEASVSIAEGDLNGDGLTDLVICNFGSANRLLLQQGN